MGFKGRKGSKKGSKKGFLEGVLRRGCQEGTSKAETRVFESTTPFACALTERGPKVQTDAEKRKIKESRPRLHTPFCSGPILESEETREGMRANKGGSSTYAFGVDSLSAPNCAI